MPKVYLKYDEPGKPSHEVKVSLPKSWCKSTKDGGKPPAEVVKLFTGAYNKKFLSSNLVETEHTLFGPPEPSAPKGKMIDTLEDTVGGISFWIRKGKQKKDNCEPPKPPPKIAAPPALSIDEIEEIEEEMAELVFQEADEAGSSELYPKSGGKVEAQDQAQELWKLAKYRLGLGQSVAALEKVNMAIAMFPTPLFLTTRAEILLRMHRPHAALADTGRVLNKNGDTETSALSVTERATAIKAAMLQCRAFVALGKWVDANAAAEQVAVLNAGSGGSPRSMDADFSVLKGKVTIMAKAISGSGAPAAEQEPGQGKEAGNTAN